MMVIFQTDGDLHAYFADHSIGVNLGQTHMSQPISSPTRHRIIYRSTDTMSYVTDSTFPSTFILLSPK